jgi:hypothetical protein
MERGPRRMTLHGAADRLIEGKPIRDYYTMTGSHLAFKEFDCKKGIWGSPWAGLHKFSTQVS